MYLGIGLGITRLSGVLGFNPASLFASGEEGAWYDPSDLTTLYQDAAGTTPAGVGDPVGLMLDKSKGGLSATELVTNGTFDTDVSGWGDLGSWTAGSVAWNAGQAEVTVSSYAGAAQQFGTGVLGKWYRVQFDVVSTGNVGRVYVGNASNVGAAASLVVASLAAGSYSYLVQATYANMAIGLSSTSGTGTVLYDNISIKELPGNHATQSTPPARPTLQTSGGLYYLDFDGVDDFLRTATFASAQSQPNTVALGYKWDVIGASKFIHDGIGTERHAIFTASGNLTAFAGVGISAGTATTNDQVLVTHFNTTNSFMRVDGSDAVTAANVGTNTWTGITLGQVASTGGNADARIYGYVGVNRTLTASEISDVETYLAAKSGVTL